MSNIFISTGDISGERYGAKLVTALLKKEPTLTITGMGGRILSESGASIVADLSAYSTIGLIEPLLFLPKYLKAYYAIKRYFKTSPPDLVVAIDFQGFNMLILKAAKAFNIPTAYYISPQEWQWGTEEGGRKVTEITDKILSIFPDEVPFYSKLNGHPIFVGHPILDMASPTQDKQALYKKLHIKSDEKILSIFPGSRFQEIKYTAPYLFKAAARLKNQYPELRIVISISHKKLGSKIKKAAQAYGLSNALFYEGNPHNLIEAATLSLVKSGTITLEHTILTTPCIACYKFSTLSYWIIRKKIEHIWKEKVSYISLPNILAKKEVIPELLQDQLTVQNIVKNASILLENVEHYNKTTNALQAIKDTLGKPGATERAANELLNMIHHNL